MKRIYNSPQTESVVITVSRNVLDISGGPGIGVGGGSGMGQ